MPALPRTMYIICKQPLCRIFASLTNGALKNSGLNCSLQFNQTSFQMKKKIANPAKLVLRKKTISALNDTEALQLKGGNSINACQLSRRNCEPSWDTGCLSHLSGCDLCPTWPTACDM